MRILLRCKEVSVEQADGKAQTLCYAGILLTGFDHDRKVTETWLPLGSEPSEADDERLIRELHEAFLWQDGG